MLNLGSGNSAQSQTDPSAHSPERHRDVLLWTIALQGILYHTIMADHR